jgi:hypothetical protein
MTIKITIQIEFDGDASAAASKLATAVAAAFGQQTEQPKAEPVVRLEDYPRHLNWYARRLAKR